MDNLGFRFGIRRLVVSVYRVVTFGLGPPTPALPHGGGREVLWAWGSSGGRKGFALGCRLGVSHPRTLVGYLGKVKVIEVLPTCRDLELPNISQKFAEEWATLKRKNGRTRIDRHQGKSSLISLSNLLPKDCSNTSELLLLWHMIHYRAQQGELAKSF